MEPLRFLRVLILAFLPCALAAATSVVDPRAAGAIQAERARVAALAADDHTALDRLLAPEMIYPHSNSVVDDKSQFMTSLTSGRLKYKSIKHADQQARVYGDSVLLTNLTRVQSVSEGQDIRVTFRTTILDVKKDGQWQFVAWHSTRVP